MVSNILLIPKGFLGDILLLTPTIEALKLSDPEVRISVLCSDKLVEFVQRDPYVDETIVLDRTVEGAGWSGLKRFAARLKERRFDRVYSFHNSPRTALILFLARIPERVGYSGAWLSFLYTRRVTKTPKQHEVIRNLELVRADLIASIQAQVDKEARMGPAHVSSFATLRLPAQDEARVSQRVREIYHDVTPYVVLAPGSAWETKRWYAEGFREVAEGFIARGIRVVLSGAESDRKRCLEIAEGLSVINLCGESSLEELTALIRRAGCLVCNDSMTLHLASALQVPSVVVFCATSPKFGFGPWKNRATILEKQDLFCKPCRRHGSRRCPTGTNACMTGVPGGEVLSAALALMGLSKGAVLRERLHVVE